jgi:hypothetical protein
MTAYRGSSGMSPLIRIFSTGWRSLFSSIHLWPYHHGRSVVTHWRWGLVGHWALLEILEKINSLSCVGYRAVNCLAFTLFTVLTTLSHHFLSVGGRIILKQTDKTLGVRVWTELVYTELVFTAYKVFTVCCFTEEDVACIFTCFVYVCVQTVIIIMSVHLYMLCCEGSYCISRPIRRTFPPLKNVT